MEQLIEALKNNKNNLLYFYNNSCGNCKKLLSKVKIMENKNPESFFQFNTHEHTKISDSFDIEYVPTLIVIENKKYKKLEGYKKIKKFYENVIKQNPNTIRG